MAPEELIAMVWRWPPMWTQWGTSFELHLPVTAGEMGRFCCGGNHSVCRPDSTRYRAATVLAGLANARRHGLGATGMGARRAQPAGEPYNETEEAFTVLSFLD